MEYIDDEEDDESYEDGDDSEDEVISIQIYLLTGKNWKSNFSLL